MRGVSEVIAIILIMMITISLAGLAYMFMSTTMSDVTASAGSTVDTTTSSMLTSFIIESLDVAKVYVRNTGQNAITSLSVYVNDEPAGFNMTPSSIQPGTVGAITIYSFMPKDATIKITSSSGFSAIKKTQDPCSKALLCWDLDESAGAAISDSTGNGKTGVFGNSPHWSAGKYGGGLEFDGYTINVSSGTCEAVSECDYAYSSSQVNLEGAESISISFWMKPKGHKAGLNTGLVGNDGFGPNTITFIWQSENKVQVYTGNSAGTAFALTDQTPIVPPYQWVHYLYIANTSNHMLYLYRNGMLADSISYSGTLNINSYLKLTRTWSTLINSIWYVDSFNGTIDEVRVYNRVIY